MRARFNSQQRSGRQSAQGDNEVIILGSGVTPLLLLLIHRKITSVLFWTHVCRQLPRSLFLPDGPSATKPKTAGKNIRAAWKAGEDRSGSQTLGVGAGN